VLYRPPAEQIDKGDKGDESGMGPALATPNSPLSKNTLYHAQKERKEKSGQPSEPGTPALADFPGTEEPDYLRERESNRVPPGVHPSGTASPPRLHYC